MGSSDSGTFGFGGGNLLLGVDGGLRQGALAGPAGKRTGCLLRRLAMASVDLGDVHLGRLGCYRPSSKRELLAVDIGDRNECVCERLRLCGLFGSSLLTSGGR